MAVPKEPLGPDVAHNEIVLADAEKDHRVHVSSEQNVREQLEGIRMNFRTILAIVSLAVTYEALLFSFVLPAAILLTINKDIGPSAQITWIATSWTLASAVLQTIAGRCSDIFGRRNFFIAGNLIAVVGCSIACRASSVNTVISGTVLMGFGAGLQFLSFAASAEIVPKKQRGVVMGSFSLVSLPGSTFGSVIAYAIVAHLSWRWTFYLGIIINALALLLVVVFYWPPDFVELHPEGKTRFGQFKELDFVGLLLFGGGLTSFLLGISFGGNPYPWRSAIVVAPTVIGGIAFLVAFPLWEIHAPKNTAKLCPPEVVKNVRGVTLPMLVMFVSGMTLMSLQVFWPQQVQLLFTQDPTMIGWYSLAYNATATAGTVIGGGLFAIIRRTKYQFIGYVWFQTVFISLMATVNQNTPAKAIVFVGLASFAIGASQTLAIVIVGLGADDKHIGVAVGLLNSLRSTGGAVGIAIYSSLFSNKISRELVPKVATAIVQAGLPVTSVEAFLVALTSGVPPSVEFVPGITPEIFAAGVDAMKDVYASGFRLIYLVGMAFGLLACLGVCFVGSVDSKLTKQIAVKVDRPHIISHGKPDTKVLDNKEPAEAIDH
ncbi:hypothetical protein LTR84_006365 [Exophiala bonariae]|uniref:Major facilitator superfamily (MFS) profile domain-containing protein n=1 Tax=Exophiala bonariae TaxID=1690606 RepID=A0AAV9N0Z9_9EURO|nr:hypothetical protein LTR84_006365 [Exophiala bonariae]